MIAAMGKKEKLKTQQPSTGILENGARHDLLKE
jgi:hypothetical protein